MKFRKMENEISARSSPAESSFSETPSGHGRPRKNKKINKLFSCAPSDGMKVFGPGREYPPGRQRDIQPQNFMFRLLFPS